VALIEREYILWQSKQAHSGGLTQQSRCGFVAQQISQTKTNSLASAALARGRDIAKKINNGKKFALKRND
jgi:hypothetical protein